jgi:hypothetical protein
MRRTIRPLGLSLFLLCSTAVAQEVPRIEVFGNYSHLVANVNGTSVNLNGWGVSVGENLNRWFGGTLDFSTHYATQAGFNVNTETLMYGPVVSYRNIPKITPFAHVLMGVVRGSPGYLGVSQADRVFGLMTGGGLDLAVNDRFAIRVLQADYLMSRFLKTRQDNIRLSAGIVLRLGSR